MLKSLTPGQQLSATRLGIISITESKTRSGDRYLKLELTHPSGNIAGKVWHDALDRFQATEGGVAEVDALVDEFMGNLNLNVKAARPVEEEDIDQYLAPVPTLVFDIETVGQEFTELSEWDQDYLLNNLEKKFDGTDKQRQQRTGLHPLYGFVAAIGMYNPVQEKGAVYYLDKTEINEEKEAFTRRSFLTEKDLLEAFWKISSRYERLVTYNGSGFDFPFLAIRSGVNQVKIPYEIGGPGSSSKFLDLQSKLRMGWRAYKLEALCRAFDISNPKEKGVSGMEVAKLYKKGQIQEIVSYVIRDVLATTELYHLWKKFLAGKPIA
jgi:DNA polymerase elongation subunit (family B)